MVLKRKNKFIGRVLFVLLITLIILLFFVVKTYWDNTVIAYKKEIEKQNTRMTSLQQEVNALKTQVAQREILINRLEKQVSEQDALIYKLQRQKQTQPKLNQIRPTVAEAESKIQFLNREILAPPYLIPIAIVGLLETQRRIMFPVF